MENHLAPNHPRWIFQARLDSYPFYYNLIEGRVECWEWAPHRNTPSRLGEDQLVLLFQQGKMSFFGFGKLIGVSKCIAHSPREHGRELCAHNHKRGTDIQYLMRFPLAIAVPPTVPRLKWDSRSIPRLITKGFRGTVHSVSKNDWDNLIAISPDLQSHFSKLVHLDHVD